MKHSEAVGHLERMLAAVQKARSIAFETDEKLGYKYLDEATMSLFDPWLFGEKNLMTSLLYVLDLDRDGVKELTPGEFLNFMIVAEKHGPIQVCAFDWDWGKSALPPPDVQWIRGWEPETETGEAAA